MHIYAYHSIPAEGGRPLAGVSFLFPLCQSLRQQAPLPTESSCHSLFQRLMGFVFDAVGAEFFRWCKFRADLFCSPFPVRQLCALAEVSASPGLLFIELSVGASDTQV